MKTLTITKEQGTVRFDRDLDSVLSALRNGRYVMTIAREKEPRSISQNALMWLWFNCIATETGTPVQDVHDYYCARFLKMPVLFNGHSALVVKGTSKLDKVRMGKFLDDVQADASTELGITLPLPSDRGFETFFQTYKS